MINLVCHDVKAVPCEDHDPIVSLVAAALLQLDGHFEQDLGVLAEDLADPLCGVLVPSTHP